MAIQMVGLSLFCGEEAPVYIYGDSDGGPLSVLCVAESLVGRVTRCLYTSVARR